MIYTVKRIDEDLDFGCEERAEDAPVMAVVTLAAPAGKELHVKVKDALLYARDINEGDRVRLDDKKQPVKASCHEMRLNPNPFAQIRFGRKTIELRLRDEKRQLVKVGDCIIFSNNQLPNLKLYTQVTSLHAYPSFAELFRHVPMEACGFPADTTIDQAVDEMLEYYSWEKESQYGALGIEIELLDADDDWTKNCSSKTVDIPAFLKRLEQMKHGIPPCAPFAVVK